MYTTHGLDTCGQIDERQRSRSVFKRSGRGAGSESTVGALRGSLMPHTQSFFPKRRTPRTGFTCLQTWQLAWFTAINSKIVIILLLILHYKEAAKIKRPKGKERVGKVINFLHPINPKKINFGHSIILHPELKKSPNHLRAIFFRSSKLS